MSIPSDAEFSEMQSTLSVAYLYAVVGKVNFAINEVGRHYDQGLGIDFEVVNCPLGAGRKAASESHEIKIQLKSVSLSSTSMIYEKDGVIKYKLDTQLNTYGVNSYLVIVQLPERSKLENWVDISPEELILRRCAFFYKIPSPFLKPGIINIPKSNIFDHNSIHSLFVSSVNKEDLL